MHVNTSSLSIALQTRRDAVNPVQLMLTRIADCHELRWCGCYAAYFSPPVLSQRLVCYHSSVRLTHTPLHAPLFICMHGPTRSRDTTLLGCMRCLVKTPSTPSHTRLRSSGSCAAAAGTHPRLPRAEMLGCNAAVFSPRVLSLRLVLISFLCQTHTPPLHAPLSICTRCTSQSRDVTLSGCMRCHVTPSSSPLPLKLTPRTNWERPSGTLTVYGTPRPNG